MKYVTTHEDVTFQCTLLVCGWYLFSHTTGCIDWSNGNVDIVGLHPNIHHLDKYTGGCLITAAVIPFVILDIDIIDVDIPTIIHIYFDGFRRRR